MALCFRFNVLMFYDLITAETTQKKSEIKNEHISIASFRFRDFQDMKAEIRRKFIFTPC